MSAILKRKWNWKVVSQNNGTFTPDAYLFVWDNINDTTIINEQTDASGEMTASITEAVYTIDNINDVSIDAKTPHVISCCKYGLVPKGLNIAFLADRLDTFFLEDNSAIDELDVTVVQDYTGINIDHSEKTITITEDHSIWELYDYCQFNMTQFPQKIIPNGVLTTLNKSDYMLGYDLIIDDTTLSGSGFIDMHDNELFLLNGAGAAQRVLDKNGILVGFSLSGLKENTEIRIYKEDDMTELAGLEDSGTSYTYNYNWTEDIDTIIVIHNIDYDTIRLNVSLTMDNTTLPIQQRFDRNKI